MNISKRENVFWYLRTIGWLRGTCTYTRVGHRDNIQARMVQGGTKVFKRVVQVWCYHGEEDMKRPMSLSIQNTHEFKMCEWPPSFLFCTHQEYFFWLQHELPIKRESQSSHCEAVIFLDSYISHCKVICHLFLIIFKKFFKHLYWSN